MVKAGHGWQVLPGPACRSEGAHPQGTRLRGRRALRTVGNADLCSLHLDKGTEMFELFKKGSSF